MERINKEIEEWTLTAKEASKAKTRYPPSETTLAKPKQITRIQRVIVSDAWSRRGRYWQQPEGENPKGSCLAPNAGHKKERVAKRREDNFR